MCEAVPTVLMKMIDFCLNYVYCYIAHVYLKGYEIDWMINSYTLRLFLIFKFMSILDFASGLHVLFIKRLYGFA